MTNTRKGAMIVCQIIKISSVLLVLDLTTSDRYVSELLEKLLSDYNKNVRPVKLVQFIPVVFWNIAKYN